MLEINSNFYNAVTVKDIVTSVHKLPHIIQKYITVFTQIPKKLSIMTRIIAKQLITSYNT